MYMKMRTHVLIALGLVLLLGSLATADEIDLFWGTFLGGEDTDRGLGIAVDGSGCVYVTGQTRSVDFPTSRGVYDETYNGGFESGDVYVAKLSPTGSNIEYATYLGGSGDDAGYGIAVDGSGSAHVTGFAESYPGAVDFPTTAGAFDGTPNGSYDVFVAKLDPAGAALDYSTFLGGGDDDLGYQITLDNSGYVYVIGRTNSGDFPATPGVFDETHNGGEDVFVAKVNLSGSDLEYATYMGGDLWERGYDIAVDRSGCAYVTGRTSSSSFPVTPGAFDETHNGGRDVFVSKLSAAGSDLEYSTFIGGSAWDWGNSIVLDDIGSAYVTGRTYSPEFPTTPGAFAPLHNGGIADAFVVKLHPTGSTLDYATFLGGSASDGGCRSTALDGSGNLYMTGYTHSADFPVTAGAFDNSYNGGADVFVVSFNPGTNVLNYATFLGGSFDDLGYGLAMDDLGDVYVTGDTWSSDFPITAGAFDVTFNGNGDAFVAKLGVGDTTVPIEATIDVDPDVLNLRNQGRWMTCYIELPQGYDVSDIDITSVCFEGSLPAAERPYGVGDEDDDGIWDLMVKFDRTEAGSLLTPGDSVEVTVSGEVLGELFCGRDVIRVIMSGHQSDVAGAVRKMRVSQNQPNPFNIKTNIRFSVTLACDVKAEIFNVLGQRVRVLLDGHLEAGEHIVEWDGRGSDGQSLATGIYFCRLTGDGLTETKKMMLLK